MQTILRLLPLSLLIVAGCEAPAASPAPLAALHDHAHW